MRRYEFTFTAEVEICAENVAQARKLAGRLSLKPGNLVGGMRPTKNRDSVPYSVRVNGERCKATSTTPRAGDTKP